MGNAGKDNWLIKEDASSLGLLPVPPLGLAPLTASLLRSRGYATPAQQEVFLAEADIHTLSDFYAIPGMREAVQGIRQAMESGKRIWIYGDYDADGMTATAILAKAFERLGHVAPYYIPDRLEEGYGLHQEAIQWIRAQGAELLVTVDCGIASVQEVAYATSIGLPVVVTDHHQAPPAIPDALAVVNPALMASPGNLRGLAGAGVAYALACSLYREYAIEDDSGALLQYAAIGTLADSMPMLGDNRTITALGLAEMNRRPLAGLRALAAHGGYEGRLVDEERVLYSIAPRLNAAGRVDDPSIGVALLLAEDTMEADPHAARLEAANKRRQELEGRIYGSILQKIDEQPALAEPPILILAGEDWHRGVIGISAAKLMEKYQKPVILVSFDNGGDIGRGSGRSLPGYGLYEALAEAAPYLDKFGGHALACGLQVQRKQFARFCAAMQQYAAAGPIDGTDGGALPMTADLLVLPAQITVASLDEMNRLAPFGAENQKPLLAMYDMRLTELKPMGQEKKHYQLFFQPVRQYEPNKGTWTAVAFNLEETMFLPQAGEVYDLLFQGEINEWQGRRTARLMLRAIRTSRLPDGGDETPTEAGAKDAQTGQDTVAQAGIFAKSAAESEPPNQPGAGGWDSYRQPILGGKAFRDKQIEALDALAAGYNTLLLMATGRGKTAVFQTAIAAQPADSAAIIIYPLRSLARDQIRRMRQVLEPLGIQSALAWGGMDHWEKRAFFNDFYQGRIKLVISTAEFLQAHIGQFQAAAGRIGLFVVDEAHHLADGRREAYKTLPGIWKKLGSPLFLATTATADDACADTIIRDFRVLRVVAEDHCRDNLALHDARGGGSEEKLAYLLGAIKADSKMIIYVNSRALTEELARTLQDNLPWMGDVIGYYHGGLPPDARQAAEKAFLSGDIRVLVSTSAFGEGADIPDIRDVALYHLCFGHAEYNQLSGRAGRDGLPAVIHLLYNQQDKDLNRMLLREDAPDRDALGSFYLYLREKAAASNPLSITDEALAEAMQARGFAEFSAKSAAYSLGVLEEIALLLREEEDGRRDIHMAPPPPTKLDLRQSSLYMEGQREGFLFEEYAEFAFSADTSLLLAGINRPILPERRQAYGKRDAN